MGFQNKKILFLGDSITALDTCERGWIKYFNEIIKPSHFVNVAVSAATLSDNQIVEFDGNPFFGGENNNYNQNVLSNQVEKICRAKDVSNKNYSYDPSYEDFDIIIIAAGTNDRFCDVKCNIEKIEDEFTKEGKPVPFDEINPTTWPGVMRKTYETLKRLYPNSVIFFCSPIQGNEISRPYYQMLYKRNLMSSICDRISDVEFIDTFNCGICNAYEKRGECGRDLIDGLHPNVNGAKKIGLFNAHAVKAYFI